MPLRRTPITHEPEVTLDFQQTDDRTSRRKKDERFPYRGHRHS